MKQRDPVGDAANSTDADVRLHGQAAQALKAAGIVVVSFSRYAPDYGAKAGQAILQKGADVTRTLEQLVDLILRLGGWACLIQSPRSRAPSSRKPSFQT